MTTIQNSYSNISIGSKNNSVEKVKDELKTFSSQKIYNTILEKEINSDKKIEKCFYYIIHLYIQNITKESKPLTEIIKFFLNERPNHVPIIGYLYNKDIYLLFSSVEENKEHYKNGSHQAICSEYTSLLSVEYGCMINCSIIEFENRIQIITYFQCKIHENTKQTIIKLSKNTITKKDIQSFTLQELIKILKDKCKIEWDTISLSKKFGTFYKYEKDKLKLLSESIDIRNIDKYQKFFFEF